MRNIIGDRVLNLPPEPRVDKTVPFKDLKVEARVKLVISQEQQELRAAVRSFLTAASPLPKVREGYDREVYARLNGELGLSGLIVPEEYGGAGAGFAELAVALEETGAALLPGPFLATAFATIALTRVPDKELLTAIAEGRITATLATGPLDRVLNGMEADVLLLRDGEVLTAVDLTAPGVTRTALETLDLTRGQARVALDGAPRRELGPLPAGVDDLLAVALAAEQLGVLRAALAAIVAYAKIRVAFWPLHRLLPGGQAQARRHALQAGAGRVDRPLRRLGRRRVAAGAARRRRARPGVRGASLLRGGPRPSAAVRRHRLHLGARRAPVLQTGQGRRSAARPATNPPGPPRRVAGAVMDISGLPGFYAIAAADPDRLAVIDVDGSRTTYGELLTRVNQVSHGLRARGLTDRDVVAGVLPNGLDAVIMMMATGQIGLYYVPINWHLTEAEVAYILADCDAKIVVTADGHVPGSEIGTAGLAEGQPADAPGGRAGGAVMWYTSGTTGRPKGVQRPLSARRARGGRPAFVWFLGIVDPGRRWPCTWSSRRCTTRRRAPTRRTALHLGHPVVIMAALRARGHLELSSATGDDTHMVPTQFHRMLRLPEEVKARYDVSSLRHVIHSAAPCPVRSSRR